MAPMRPAECGDESGGEASDPKGVNRGTTGTHHQSRGDASVSKVDPSTPQRPLTARG